MRYAIIENNTVTNIAIADKPFGSNWVQSDTANIGDLYDGEAFSAPPIPQEEIDAAWRALRARRDGLLTACDWTQLTDAPLSVELKIQWGEYRQALRDLPANTTDPFNPSWPEEPA